MSKTIKIRKGLDIKLIGEADKVKATVSAPIFAIKPPDFHGLVPKMTVKAGDKVKAGSIIFTNKYQEEVKFVSPISGEIAEIVRGEKRRILAVTIKPDASNEAESFGKIDPSNMDGEAVKAALLANGFWPFIKMRPLDIVANPYDKPKAIFVSAFDSSPLAPDYDYILHGENDAFQAGLTALSKLTEGKVHLTVRSDMNIDSTFTSAKGVQINKINSKHPAGNVGTQIHHIDPINKNEIVWTVNAIDVALIGRSLLAGQFDGSRTVALTGSEVKKPKYIKTAIGANIAAIIEDNIEGDNVRYISGNVLTGDKVETTGFLGFYHNHVTVIPEGNESKFMITKGWLSPGLSKFSINRS